jgi:hypothetical protein
MIRYVGLFSNRWKQQYLTEARNALNQPEPDYDTSVNNHMLENTTPLASWAKRQTDFTGIDPLVCPNCGKPLSFIGIFLGSYRRSSMYF